MHNPNKKTIAITINTFWNIFNFRIGLLKALKIKSYNIIAIAPYDFHTQKLIGYRFKYHNVKINDKVTNPTERLKLIMEFYKDKIRKILS